MGCVRGGEEVPAVHHNGVVSCPSLHLVHLFDNISDGGEVITHPIRCPVGDVELGHLMYLCTLQMFS